MQWARSVDNPCMTRGVSLIELVQSTPGSVLHRSASGAVPLPQRITGVTDDSRDCRPGALFIAIRGHATDGHRFAAAAVQAGACALVVDHPMDELESVPQVVCPDTRLAAALMSARVYGLEALFAGADPRLALLAVTGTNGKTTTSYLMQAICNGLGRPAGRIGTIDHDLGTRRVAAVNTTPGAVLLARCIREMADNGLAACAFEASSHALDQRRLDGLRPHVACFTNLTGDHLDYHGTMENYERAKGRLFDLLRPGGCAVIHLGDAAGVRYAAQVAGRGDCRVIGYRIDGVEAGADRLPAGASGAAASLVEHSGDVLVGRIRQISASGTWFDVEHGGLRASVRSGLIGRHNVENLLAAIGAGLALGWELELVCGAASRLGHVPGRLQRVAAGDPSLTVVVDYAHTDDALANVLSALRPLCRGRLICLFGCGGDRDRTKRPRMAATAQRLADRLVVTSDNPRTEDPQRILDDIVSGLDEAGRRAAIVEPDRRRAIEAAIGLAAPGDCVLLAGKGHEDYQIIGTQKTHFDDAEVAAAVLNGRSGSAA